MTFKIKNEIQYRSITLDRAAIDNATRTIPASLSSEAVVARSFGDEVLSHDPAHVDLARAEGGLPLLFSHDHEAFLGRVQDVHLDGGRLRGVLHFSDNSRADEVWQDVRNGMLRDMSIGYRINKAEETDTGYRAVDWSLLEASVVAVPADTSVGINRSMENDMTDTTETPHGGDTPAGESVVVDFTETHKRAVESGQQKGIKAERKRVADIQDAFARHEGDDIASLMRSCIDGGLTIEQSQRALLNHLGGMAEPIATAGIPQTGERTDIQMGRTGKEKLLDGMREALLFKTGERGLADKMGTNPFVGMSVSEMAREYLREQGAVMNGWDKMRIMGEAFMKRDVTETPFDMTVSDFPSLLANVAYNSLLRGYNEAPETWRGFCTTSAVNDFKVNQRTNVSMFPDLETVAENGAFPLKQVSDWHENIQAATKGARFSITRQALVNDSLDGLARVPQAMGRAAARSVGDAVYNQLLTIQTMNEDGNPLFDAANHNNVDAAAAPSVDTVDAIRVAMGTQTDPSGATLNIRPAKLICGLGYEGTASTLRNAQFDPDTPDGSGNTSGNRPNWVAGTFEVIADARIDADANSTNWFMTADPMMHDTIDVAFLNGVETPYLEQREGFTIDGQEFKVRLDFGVAPMDWRTIHLNGTAPV